MNNNIVLDFTVNKSIENAIGGQPLAVMPAGLAKRLLEMYAEKLSVSTSRHIIGAFRDSINVHGELDAAIVQALEFVQERELISNITARNWEAYAVNSELIAQAL